MAINVRVVDDACRNGLATRLLGLTNPVKANAADMAVMDATTSRYFRVIIILIDWLSFVGLISGMK